MMFVAVDIYFTSYNSVTRVAKVMCFDQVLGLYYSSSSPSLLEYSLSLGRYPIPRLST